MLGIRVVKNQVSKGFKELLGLNDGLQLCHISHYEKILARDDSKVLCSHSGRRAKEQAFSLLPSGLLKTDVNSHL